MEISKSFLWRDSETGRRGDETARRDGETAWRDGETAESRGPKICTVIFKFLDTSFLDIFWASFSLAIRARRGVGRDGKSGETGSRARREVGRDGESGETGIRHPQFFVNAYDTYSCKWEKQVEIIYSPLV